MIMSLRFLRNVPQLNVVVRWWPIVVGLLSLYVPTYVKLSQDFWLSSDQAHGPIVLMIVLYLFWLKKDVLLSEHLPPSSMESLVGWVLLVLGLLMYALGHSQDILILDIGSQLPVLMGVILLMQGTVALKRLWFPLVFIIFMLPLPLDGITMPMKMAVSYVTDAILHTAGYPIAREGVILHIGQYQLFVADACAGMHTLISLEAVGLLYLNLVRHDSWLRNLTLAIFIIPISFSANVLRVITLTLITYYFGDAVAQGFIHGFAGMFLFVVALILIICLDNVVQWVIQKRVKA